MQVHGEHDAVVVFDGEETLVVRKGLVEDLVLQYNSMSTAAEEEGGTRRGVRGVCWWAGRRVCVGILCETAPSQFFSHVNV